MQLYGNNRQIYVNCIRISFPREKLKKGSRKCSEKFQKQLVKGALITSCTRSSEDLQKTSVVNVNFSKLSLGCVVTRS